MGTCSSTTESEFNLVGPRSSKPVPNLRTNSFTRKTSIQIPAISEPRETPCCLSRIELSRFVQNLGYTRFQEYCLRLDLRGYEKDSEWKYAVRIQNLGPDADPREVRELTDRLVRKCELNESRSRFIF